MKRIIYTGILFLLYLMLHSCAVNPVTGKSELMLLSSEDEKALGKQSDQEIVAMMGVYEDAGLQDFLSRTGQRMAEQSHRPELDYTFRIIDSPVINAFAVPGGYVYFTRGILAHFNNEAELAGVLGHEIGHITARHSAKQYSKAMLAQGGLTLGLILSPEFRQYEQFAQLGTSLLFLKFGRDAERQSDKLGAEYSTMLGYDAGEMENFFAMLENQHATGGQSIPDFLSTHPDPGERRESVRKHAQKFQEEGTTYAVNRDEYLALVDGLIYGEDPRQGFVENGTFYHPEMAFSFDIPADWAVMNSPSMVQMNPEDQSALIQFTLEEASTAEDAIRAMGERYGLTLREPTTFEAGNGKITRASFVIESDTQPLQGLILVSRFQSDYVAFTSVALPEKYQGLEKAALTTAGSFRTVNDPDILNRQPERIRIKTVSSTAVFSEQIRAFGVPAERTGELALLNGISPDETVSAGTRIKIVVRENASNM